MVMNQNVLVLKIEDKVDLDIKPVCNLFLHILSSKPFIRGIAL